MVSKPVRHLDLFVNDTLKHLEQVRVQYNYTCLAAIHIGIPIRVFSLHGVFFINPRLQSHGQAISKARESSAFWPQRPPVIVTRYLPVTISSDHHEGVYMSRTSVEGHCILHILDQMRGTSMYDT
jgi:peptide deformylase